VLYSRHSALDDYDWPMMRRRWLLMGWICLSLGVGMLLWGWPTQSANGASRAALTVTDHITFLGIAQTNLIPTPRFNPTATPPSQGGHGHDLFDLYCMPCHGDQGQGLTDEFRNRQYPPEDVNCWKSGCHGARPYENGFTLPQTIPAVIGPNTLTKFATARNMFDYMRAAMPFNAPGSLSEEQYLQLLAYLLEQNKFVTTGAQLDPDLLQQISLRPEPVPTPTAGDAVASSDTSSAVVIAIVLLLGMVVLAVLIIRRLSRQAPH
jgi:mono/diheme cytochrome c family protein